MAGWRDVTHCPTCRESLRPGTLVGHAPGIGFVPERAPSLELSLSSESLGHRLVALRCERCGTVVVPGSLTR